MSKLCKTCKYWLKEDMYPFSGNVPELGECRAVMQLWDATEWNDDGESRKIKDECIGKLAFVQDASDYRAYLKTMPDFGCVQYENI
ncbi:MAG: hypothetical protein WC707_07130 [Candidatus Babeliaceae bacterium]|jgi:hypothetical protein